MFTSFVPNFLGFTAIGVILVAMIGVGVAELSGLVGGLIRKLVAVSTPASLTYIIVFVGILSSVAADAGYLVLIPLAATAFLSVGRNPLAGIAAGFGAVSAAFGVNVLIVPADAVVTDITNEAAALVDPNAQIDLVSNLYFGIGCTLFLTVVIALVTTRIIEPRLGAWDRSLADEEELAREEGQEVDPALEAKGLRRAGLAVLAVLAVIAVLTLPPGAPLRNPETGDIIGDSPFMSSLIVMISLAFLAAGIAYGRVVGTVKGSDDVLAMITKSWASLASLLFLFLLIAQFIAYFDFSNMAQVAAVWLGDILEELDLGDLWLLLGVMIVTVDRGPRDPGEDREVGDPRPDLRAADAAARHRAADRAGGLPRRRFADQRAHAADAVLRADGRLRAALPAGRGHRDGDRADDPVHARRHRRVDALLHRVVPARDPGRAGMADPLTSRAWTTPPSPWSSSRRPSRSSSGTACRSPSSRSASRSRSTRPGCCRSSSRWPGSATRPSCSSPRCS